jgi:hypothetical protein
MGAELMPAQTDEAPQDEQGLPGSSNWAQPVTRLKVGHLPGNAVNLNVDGRQVLSPLHGFGPLWQKTYRIRLTGAAVTPQDVIAEWKQGYASFWPKGNGFYSSWTSIAPGAVAVLDLQLMGPVRLSTGILVVYADDTCFCFMTPQGHMFAGMITFSAEQEAGTTVAQVQALLRTSDPLYEITYRAGILHRIEDRFWDKTLANLGTHFGVQGRVEQKNELLDSTVQWSEAKNIWQSAAIRTVLYTVASPLRWLRDRIVPS